MSYDALLLDFDGVVVNVLPEETRLPAFRDRIGAELADHEVDDAVVAELATSVSYERLQALSDRTGLSPDRLWQARDDAIATVLDQAADRGEKTPFEDVSELSAVSAPVGIVSNNQRRVVESLSDQFGLSDRFAAIRARDPRPASLREKKPEPTFVEAVRRAVGAERPVFVGDKESDVRAGKRAGVDTVLLRRVHNADRPVAVEPTHEAHSLGEVVSLLDGSVR